MTKLKLINIYNSLLKSASIYNYALISGEYM